jgi:hypothetical protein
MATDDLIARLLDATDDAAGAPSPTESTRRPGPLT